MRKGAEERSGRLAPRVEQEVEEELQFEGEEDVEE